MDALPASPKDSTNALMRRLWREHVRHHRGRLGLVALLTLAMAGLTALYPLVINRAFTLFELRDQRILYQIPILVVAVTAAKAAAQYGQNVMVQQVVLLVIRELQSRLFAHLSHADLAQVEREAPAALSARFTTDAALIRESLTRAVQGVKDAVTVAGLIVSMLYLDWVLSAIAAALYPLAALPIQRLGKRIRRASGGMQERMGETAALLYESFAQARTIRAYRLEGAEGARADAAFSTLYRALFRMTRSRARVDPLLEVLGGTAIAAVIGFAGWRSAVGDGGGIGSFSGFVASLLMASQPLRALGSLNAALQEGLAGLSRVFGVVDEPPAIRERPGAPPLPPGRGQVRFEAVGFTYPDGRAGLHGLSFTAAPGLTLALVGPSGAGKSTALAMIPRLQDATSGRVLVDGADVRDVTLGSLRDAIAYVGQDTLLFDDTVAANIRMGRPGATDADVEGRRPCRRRGLRGRLAGRVLHPRRSRRRPAVRRPAAADRPCPRAAPQPAHPVAGRGDQRPGCRERGRRAIRPGPAARRAHDHRGGAPPQHRQGRRSGGGDGGGPGRRARHPCRAAGGWRAVCPFGADTGAGSVGTRAQSCRGPRPFTRPVQHVARFQGWRDTGNRCRSAPSKGHRQTAILRDDGGLAGREPQFGVGVSGSNIAPGCIRRRAIRG